MLLPTSITSNTLPTLFLLLVSMFVSLALEMSSDSVFIKPSITRGMMIDAGSGGSRLHVYSWSPRIFDTIPPPLSFPTANEKWTNRNAPGISQFADNLDMLESHLSPLIDFAKSVLAGHEREFSQYPIFFKATGGMRELPMNSRERVLNRVRILLSDKKFNPFYFRNDFARVISGEEEAIYSWCGTNFLMGSLLPSSKGIGAVVAPINKTYGTLDLGGSSTQIAFFEPNQDIMEGLFKLQIGGHKHWNVYSKSFLQFGVNSARRRFLQSIANAYVASHKDRDRAVVPEALTYCFHSGFSEQVLSSADNTSIVLITGPAVPAGDQLERCLNELRPLLFKDNVQSMKIRSSESSDSVDSERDNSYCNLVYHGQCSVGGAYQPPLPRGRFGDFIGTSSYAYIWKFLLLPKQAELEQLKQRTEFICSLNFGQIQDYYTNNNLNIANEKLSDYMPYYCFLSAYTLSLLVDGYGFRLNDTLTVFDELNGNKVGWPLGAILYEINALPWEYREPRSFWALTMTIGFVLGGLVVWHYCNNINNSKLVSSHHGDTASRTNSVSHDDIGSPRDSQAHSKTQKSHQTKRSVHWDVMWSKETPQDRHEYHKLNTTKDTEMGSHPHGMRYGSLANNEKGSKTSIEPIA